jgi:DNA-binding beta-propeller fold protein YncE
MHRIEEMNVIAADSADALRAGDRVGALRLALLAAPNEADGDIPHGAAARKALADALGAYDLSDGFRPLRTVMLPSETMALAIAPDGRSLAAMSFGTMSVFDTVSGELLDQLPATESGLADVFFIDSKTIAYAGAGGLTVYSLSSGSALWTGSVATTIAVSSDGRTIAAINRDESTATVYSIGGSILSSVDFGGRHLFVPVNDRLGNPGRDIFRLNHDGTLLAVSFSNGGLEIFNLADRRMSIELFEESNYTCFEGGFYGKYFAFSAANAEESLFSVIDTERFIVTISTTLPGRIGVFADESGIYMSYNEMHVLIDPQTATQTSLEHNPGDHIAGGYRVDGSLNSPIVRISKYVSHEDKEILSYNPRFVHYEARLNIEGTRVMLFSFNRFRIYNINGRLINDTPIPNSGQVHDQQFRRHGGESYLEVIYNDGTVHKYSGENGALIAIESISPPDPSLHNEFITDNWRILSPLHGTPRAYNISTGVLIRELERDAFLTYVTQAGKYVITEYISAYGYRFGLLLDGSTCETLAYIPNLSDIIGERLIVDIRSKGSLREVQLYSTEELIKLAREVLAGK